MDALLIVKLLQAIHAQLLTSPALNAETQSLMGLMSVTMETIKITMDAVRPVKLSRDIPAQPLFLNLSALIIVETGNCSQQLNNATMEEH